MKRVFFTPLLMMGAFLMLMPKEMNVSANSGYGGGSGTQDDPYLISTPEHLNQLQLDVNVNGIDTKGKYYQLMNNIDLSGYDNDSDETNGNWNPIGNNQVLFKGTFDGNGKIISNLEIILPEESFVGLFGNVNSATIRNLGLENVLIEGNESVGGLVGEQSSGTITQSYVTGRVTGKDYYVGGLVGYSSGTIITQSYVTGEVIGDGNVGGLVGYQAGASSQITQSYATGEVSGTRNVGGLVGYQAIGMTSQSYSTGTVNGTSYVGGLVGCLSSSGKVNESYSAGKVSGKSSVGGLLGNATTGATITHSYWDVETSGQSGDRSGVGLTTEEMTKTNALTHMSGFDFDTVWQTSDTYPLLRWQLSDPITEDEIDLTIKGTIETTILSLTIPSNSMSFILNPNEEVGKQFVASDFELINGSQTPLTLEIKTFEQVTDVLNDVEPTKYSDWNGLNKTESKDIALALVPKTGDGWLSLNEGDRWVADLGNPQIGTMKGNSTVSFGFEAKHGLAFSEALMPQYRLTFVFGLQD